jgi:hypothetical protein
MWPKRILFGQPGHIEFQQAITPKPGPFTSASAACFLEHREGQLDR